MTKKELDLIMEKKWNALCRKLPYGLQWLTRSAELYEWSEKKKKTVTK